MTNEQQNELYERLAELNGRDVLELFTDYHGLQILDDGFAQFCVDEGEIELDWIED